MSTYTTAFDAGLKPDEKLTMLEWADKYFHLPRESSAEHGKYRSDRTPMVKEVLEELSPSCPTERVVLMKPTQLAGTTVALIIMLAGVDIAPGPGLFIQPTGDLARAFSKKKLTPSLAATITGSGRLKGCIRDVKSRSGDSIHDTGKSIPWRQLAAGWQQLSGSVPIRECEIFNFR